jgi:splicing factor 3B subunit 2
VDADQLGEDDKLDKDALKEYKSRQKAGATMLNKATSKKEYESSQKAEAAGQWQSIDQEDLADHRPTATQPLCLAELDS